MTVFVCGIVLLLLFQVSKIKSSCYHEHFFGGPRDEVCHFSVLLALLGGDRATLHVPCNQPAHDSCEPGSSRTFQLHLILVYKGMKPTLLGEAGCFWNELMVFPLWDPKAWNYKCKKRIIFKVVILGRFCFLFFFFCTSQKFTSHARGERTSAGWYVSRSDFCLEWPWFTQKYCGSSLL